MVTAAACRVNVSGPLGCKCPKRAGGVEEGVKFRFGKFGVVFGPISVEKAMTTRRIFGAVAAGVLVAAAGVAVAANFTSSARTDFYSPGKHQFYVWCASGSDYMTIAAGKSAEDAQMKLYRQTKAHGKSSCWPVWQGRVPA